MKQPPYNRVGFHPLYTAINQGFGHCSPDQEDAKTNTSNSQNIPWDIYGIFTDPWMVEFYGKLVGK